MAKVKITTTSSDGVISVKEYIVTEEQVAKIKIFFAELHKKKEDLANNKVRLMCKDKDRLANEICKYPVNSCVMCRIS